MFGIYGKRSNSKIITSAKLSFNFFHIFIHDRTDARTRSKEKLRDIDLSLKIFIRYESLKTKESEWRKLIKFIFHDFNDDAFQYAKAQTEFEKLQNENKNNRPPELAFFRKGQSNYVNELPSEQKTKLVEWPGYKDLTRKIGKL